MINTNKLLKNVQSFHKLLEIRDDNLLKTDMLFYNFRFHEKLL